MWPNSASHVATCRRVHFSIGLKICACQCVEKCFSARLPSEGRSERDAHVGELVGRKISSEKDVGDRVF